MRYEIGRNTGDQHRVQTITRDEFSAIEESQDELLRRLAIEQQYDLLIANFLDLEVTLFTIAARFSVRPFTLREHESVDERASINRVLMNFLSSARGYIDQTKAGASPADLSKIESWFSEDYDSSLAYRVVEALRNYTQHRGLPTHVITYHSRWENKSSKKTRTAIYAVIPSLSVETLKKDKKFKSSVLTELGAISPDHPIVPYIREYLSKLSLTNGKIRALYETREQSWVGKLEGTATNYCQYDGNSLATGVHARRINDKGHVEREIFLMTGIGATLNRLERSNQPLPNLAVQRPTT